MFTAGGILDRATGLLAWIVLFLVAAQALGKPLVASAFIAGHKARLAFFAVLAIACRGYVLSWIRAARMGTVTPQLKPEYYMLEPEDPNVLRLMKDRLEEKGSLGVIDVIGLVDDVLASAIFVGASDVHIEAKAKSMRLSYRIDGILTDIAQMPKETHQPLVNRLKIKSSLDISRTDVPQDGRLSASVAGKTFNIRISALPTMHGETVVLRILGSSKKTWELSDFHLQPATMEGFKRVIHSPQGIVLFTGPTGSGKTSLMYAALREIRGGEKARRNICTLEDPIEQEVEDINQSAIDLKRGVTFAAGLRSILRQDPDIIMVGEIRDLETAQIAVQAGQTGHMIISTVHANSAVGAFTRLLDMGLEPFQVSSCISGVIAQRLVRKLCPKCVQPAEPDLVALEMLATDIPKDFRCFSAPGCSYCGNSGYRGRLAVVEFLRMSDQIASAITSKANLAELGNIARSEGMISLREDGVQKAMEGLTSVEELVRVVAAA